MITNGKHANGKPKHAGVRGRQAGNATKQDESRDSPCGTRLGGDEYDPAALQAEAEESEAEEEGVKTSVVCV